MPDFIDRVPNEEELAQWSASRKDAQTLDNFKFGGADYLEDSFNHAVASINSNEALSDEIKQQVLEVLAKGSLNGRRLGHPDANRNVSGEWSEREYIAKILVSGHEGEKAAEAIAEKGICGFHSTRSQALAGMLETGFLMSAKKLNEKGLTMVTGEHYYQDSDQGQDSVSFSNLDYSRDAALNHAGKLGVTVRDKETVIRDMREVIEELENMAKQSEGKSHILAAAADRHKLAADRIEADPDSLFTALSMHEFPVMVGLSSEYLDESEERRHGGRIIVPGGSHLGELRPVDEQIPLRALPVVAVPKQVVAPVQELFTMYGYLDTKIIAIEPLVA